MEQALLQGERESEVVRLRQEQEAVQQLQEKLSSLDASIRKEQDKVSPVTGSHCHQLCHTLPGTHTQYCNASCCSIPLWTCSPDPGLHRGFGEQPLWFALWGDLSVCLGLVKQPCWRRARPTCRKHFGCCLLLWQGDCDVRLSEWLLPVVGSAKEEALAFPITCPCWGTASCSKSPHSAAPSCVMAAVAVLFSLLEMAGKLLQVFNLVALEEGPSPLAPDVACDAVIA